MLKNLFIFLLMYFIAFTAFAQEYSNIDSLKIALYQEDNSQKKVDILIDLTEILLITNPEKALEYANQTLELSEENNNLESKVKAYLQIGKVYRTRSDFRESMEMGNKAKLLASDLELDKEYAESLILIAINFSNLGDYAKSADLNFQALRIFEEIDHKKGIGEVYSRIGSDLFYQDNYDKAVEYFTQSLTIAREIKDLPGIARGLNNRAIVYAEIGENKNFITNLKESIEINKLLGRPLWEGINYLNLGTQYRNEKNFDTSFYYLKKAKIIFTHLNNLPNIANINNSLSMYYSDLGNMDSSLYYARLAYEIGQENNLKVVVYEAVQQQRSIFNQLNDFENAFKYSMIELKLKDSLDTQNTLTRISQLELLYEFEKIEQENKIKQERREYFYILGGTAIVFILILFLLIIITRNRLKSKNEQIERRRLNMELEIKNKELASNVMTLIRKNEILSGIGDKLMNIQINAVKEETKSAIKKIARELRKTTDDEIWDEFDIRFKQVHGEFYSKLLVQFPDLSPNEHRLCAFLRLNMSTKEISELTGQRNDTLEIARWRLRKKLKITNTNTNLITFLSEI